MTVSAAMLRKLSTLNLSGDQMAGVLEMLAEQSEVEEARRASQRDRTRKSRMKRDGNVTVTAASQGGNDAPPSPKEIPHTPLEITPYPQAPATPKGVSPPTAKRSCRLDADWVLPAEWRAEAIQSGLPANRADLEGAKMRDWSLSSKNGAKLDWHATWRNWVKDAIDRLPKAIGSPGGKPMTASQLAMSRAQEGYQNAQSQAERDDRLAPFLIPQFSERGR